MATVYTYTHSFPNGAKVTITATWDVTFGEFGVRVSVTAPPASQVYNLGNRYAIVDAPSGEIVLEDLGNRHLYVRHPRWADSHRAG